MKKLLILLTLIIVSLVCFLSQNLQAEPKKLTFSSAKFEPYCSPDLLNEGYYTEICKEAFKRVGYEIEIKFMPFPRALKSSASWVCDGALCIFRNKEREKTYIFSEMLASADVCFFKLKGTDIKFENLEDLKPYTIGVTRGGSYSKELNNADYLKKDEAKEGVTHIKKLLAGRIDLLINPKISLFRNVKKYFPDKVGLIEPLPKPLSSNEMYLALSRKRSDAAEIMNDFNRGLKGVKDDGTFNKILKKHNIPLY